ncbi:MAG TPA: hypothetical protein VGE52_21615, partial [Pirellulales bacterium]
PVALEEDIDTPFAVKESPAVEPLPAPQPATIEPYAPRGPSPDAALPPSAPSSEYAPISEPPLAVEPVWGPTPPSLSSAGVSPELWIYLQERSDRLDPKLAVRAKAALEAEQRQARIAARKWYGTSLARPVVSPTPFMSGYAPGWEPAARWQKPIEPVVVPATPAVVEVDPERSHHPYGRGR